MGKTTRYYRTVVEKDSVKMTYDSEVDLIRVEIERKLKMGSTVGTDRFEIALSDVEPFIAMLTETSQEAKLMVLESPEGSRLTSKGETE